MHSNYTTPLSKRILNILVYLLGLNLIFEFVAIFVLSPWFSLEDILGDKIAITTFVVYGISALSIVLLNAKVLISDFKKIKVHAKMFFSSIMKYIALIYLFNIILSFVLPYLAGTDVVSNQQGIENQALTYPIFTIVTTVIFAPIVEEMVFRYSLMNIDISSRFKRVLLLIVSSFIFGSIHMLASIQSGNLNELWFIFQYAAMGLAIGLSYFKTENIWTPIAVHLVNNLIATIVIVLL